MSYLYSSGVVSVKEAGLLPKDFYANVLSCGASCDAESLIRNALHIREDLSIDEGLEDEEYKLFEFVAGNSPNDLVKNFFIFPLVFDNLATICKAQLVGIDWENYVQNYDFLDNKKVASFVAKRDFSIFEKNVAKVVKEFFENYSPQSKAEDLDLFFKQNKYKIMREMFKKGLLLALVKLECDKQNLSICLRAKNEIEFEKNLVVCGFLDKKTLQRIFEKDKFCVGQIENVLLKNMAELVFENKEKALVKFEKEKNMLLLKFCEPLRFDMDGPAQFMYYVFRKLAEIKNCRMCLLFVRNNFADRAKQMLLGDWNGR